jgi:hypothetical protein
VSFDLGLDPEALALADAVAQFCRERCPEAVARAAGEAFPEPAWRELASLGVLAIATPEGDGGPLEQVAACESLGAAVFPGPLVGAAFAVQVLPEKERVAVASGEVLPAVGTPPLLPWAPRAGVFVELAGERAFLARPRGRVEGVATLAGEPWGRVALERERELEGVARGRAHADLARAAYLVGAGERLLADACEHARTRRQFGRPIGDFQAVAHPLAECGMRLDAARTATRLAAARLAAAGAATPRGAESGLFERADGAALAAAARLAAARAALHAAATAHQTFGAVGMTIEGRVWWISRRIRQLAGEPPDAAPARAALAAFAGLEEAKP